MIFSLLIISYGIAMFLASFLIGLIPLVYLTPQDDRDAIPKAVVKKLKLVPTAPSTSEQPPPGNPITSAKNPESTGGESRTDDRHILINLPSPVRPVEEECCDSHDGAGDGGEGDSEATDYFFSIRAIRTRAINRLMSIAGAGLLLGSALLIVLPEGISAALKQPECKLKALDLEQFESSSTDASSNSHSGHHGGFWESPGFKIGIPILVGFIFMLLVDLVSHLLEEINQGPGGQHRYSRIADAEEPSHNNNNNNNNEEFELLDRKDQKSHSHHHSSVNNNTNDEKRGGASSSSLVLAMLIHGFADGVALGSSLLHDSSSSSSLGFILFLAIVVHKGPSAFGMVTTLMLASGSSLNLRSIRRRLVLFSAAGPFGLFLVASIGSLVMRFGSSATSNYSASLIGGSRQSVDESSSPSSSSTSSVWLMLFSGGSFLYVATMHVLPTIIFDNKGSESNHCNLPPSKSRQQPKKSIPILNNCIDQFLILFDPDVKHQLPYHQSSSLSSSSASSPDTPGGKRGVVNRGRDWRWQNNLLKAALFEWSLLLFTSVLPLMLMSLVPHSH